MTSVERQGYFHALGLTDWRARVDGPLAGHAVPAPTDDPAAPEDAVVAAQATARPAAEATASRPLAPTPEASDTPAAPSASADLRAMDWTALEAHLARCDHRGASRAVFGVGARDADVLIVGEAPGAREDEQGVPFVGRAGQLLDRMLFAIGCSRQTNVYITNICKFRPPNNRDPRPEEVAADWPILERQIELMAPKLVVAVGRVAAQTLLGSSDSLGALRGRLHKYPRRELDVLVTYHPAFLLRSPQMKDRAWADLKRIAARIGDHGQRTA